MIPVPSGFAPIAAAAVSKKRRQIMGSFRAAGATAPETSKSLAEIGVSNSLLLQVQKLKGVLVESSEGRYYLDEVREKQVDRFRRCLAGGFAGLCVLLLLTAWWLSRG